MKQLITATSLLLLSACGSPTENAVGEAPAVEQLDLSTTANAQLASLDPQICTNPLILGHITETVTDEALRSGATTWISSDFDAFKSSAIVTITDITLEASDPSTSTITCNGTFNATWSGRGAQARATYGVQPALDGENPIVTIYDQENLERVVVRAGSAYHTDVVAPREIAERAPLLAAAKVEAEQLCQAVGAAAPTEEQRWKAHELKDMLANRGTTEYDAVSQCLLELVFVTGPS